MARVMIRRIRHIKCDCGQEFQTFGTESYHECFNGDCRRAYRIEDKKLVFVGYKCWACGNYVDALYAEDKVCKDCITTIIRYWEQQVEVGKSRLEYCKERLKKAVEEGEKLKVV